MPTAKLDNIEMHYEVCGSGRPLVLIAGYACDHAFWNGMVPALAKQVQVVAFDNRAVGRSKDDGGPISIELMAADTAALIQRLGLVRPAIVGQSMGGAIAQTMLMRHPDACGRCVILNSAQNFRTVAVKALESLLALRAANVDLDLLIDASLPWVAGSEWLAKPENVAAFKAAIKGNPAPQTLRDQERQLVAIKHFDARPLNRPWAHPAMVVSATDDVLTLPEEGKLMADRLGGQFVEVPGGHGSPIEQPELLSRILLQFVAR